jgi:uncharacterized protein YbjT (DUF2867 family)
MDVVVAGGHGQVALRLLKLLSERGHRARGIIRNPDHAADLDRVGAEPIVFDLEDEEADLAAAIDGADAVVFAAGAGPGSGPERKRTVDAGAAVRLIEACQADGIDRYVMVSAMGVSQADTWSDEMRPYYQAKLDADIALQASGLSYTIVRPGSLTDDPGTGMVEIAERLERGGGIPRDDVAAVLMEVLDTPATARLAFDLLAGETPVEDAVQSMSQAAPEPATNS